VPAVAPRVIIRLGSHAEKEYVEKTMKLLDGLMIGANLVEATPGATASLAVRFSGPKEPSVPVFIDPMTYAFGTYVDRQSGASRDDLDWIKSDQKVKGVVKRDFKRSYSSLAERLGGLFQAALDRRRALGPDDFKDANDRRAFVDSVIQYQLERVRDELAKDPDFGDLAEHVPGPPVVFAPYFYIDPTLEESWTDTVIGLAAEAAARHKDTPVHSILCADDSFLLNDAFLRRVREELPDTGIQGVWLWFSKFAEDDAAAAQLEAYRALVQDLSSRMEVYQLHGGYFSLALSRIGLQGISHGVGYGEQKDVIPIIGQSTPTVQFYLPPLHRRLSVPQIERCFDALGIHKAEDFFDQVCDCVVCKGVLSGDLARFSDFGDMHYSRPLSKRLAQTPAAAKRCRFHFLLRRFAERDWVATASLQQIRDDLQAAAEKWLPQPSIGRKGEHMPRWIAALG
jgi:hypothetical protein